MKAIEYTEKSKKAVEEEISRYKHAKELISKAERTSLTRRWHTYTRGSINGSKICK